MGCSFSVVDVWFVANSPISNPEKGEQVGIEFVFVRVG
jgi:hypothetical protein